MSGKFYSKTFVFCGGYVSPLELFDCIVGKHDLFVVLNQEMDTLLKGKREMGVTNVTY